MRKLNAIQLNQILYLLKSVLKTTIAIFLNGAHMQNYDIKVLLSFEGDIMLVKSRINSRWKISFNESFVMFLNCSDSINPKW